MAIVTGDRYLEHLVKFVEKQAGPLIEGTLVLKLNPVGLHYVQSRLEAFAELENLLTGAPVDYLRAYISDLGDHRALEQLRRILRLLTSLKVVSVLPVPARDPTPLSLLPFGRLKVLELRGCDLSTSAARGLLELKHTLEKIICHNSTDALRHLFASRIAEIKDSPHWNRLQFVSCACNGLVVMDESLQLISAVETLDLSRNRFTKVDNLRKCSKLKHLDLGFNHFTTIASLSEVSCHIVRLVLRNNALTTLRGIENLKSLEGLDLSYNIISNFSEIEILAGLPCLRNLWLEGNPLCCARWYRSQVFSLFTHPDTLILDEKEISTREFLKRQIIIASRQKRPASFGFYYPAKDDADGVGSGNMKRKKFSRLACIAGEEQSMCSDQESVSCDNEIHSREEDVISNDEAEVVDLMNRVELMKKERSVLWLREFKEWMDITSENMGESSTYSGAVLGPDKNNYLEKKTKQMHLGESSRYVSDSFQASGDESSTNILESDNSFADTSMNLHTHQYFDRLGEAASKFSMYDKCGYSAPFMGSMDSRQNEGINHMSLKDKISHPDTVTSQRGHRSITDASGTSVTAIDGKMESHLSSASPGSPPHYQEDLLHRRHNLVEEILQLSAGSFSAISSDSNTSCSEDDNYEFCSSVADCDQLLDGELSNMLADGNSSKTLVEDKNCDPGYEVSWGDYWAKKFQKKQKRRVVSLLEPEDKNIIDKADIPEELNGNQDICKDDLEEQLGKSTTDESDVKELSDKKQGWTYKITSSLLDDADRVLYGAEQSILVSDDFVHNYFNSNVADFRVNETCRKYLRCDCIFEQESRCREVAVLLSSENILYLLHIDVTFDGSGTILRLMGRHRAEDIGEVLVGLGLQVVRVSIERDVSYLFMTRSIEKSRQLLYALQVAHSYGANHKCPLRSLEQVQVDLFDKLICRGSKMSIFQYSMVLFLRDNSEEESWVLRSLFVIGGHLLVCIEDLMLLRSLSEDASSSSYISLDSCCSIADISEMVIEVRESQSVTLALECPTSEFHPSDEKAHNTKEEVETASICLKWKLKWFSDESLLKFAALLKALHAGATMSPLLVRCIP